MRSINISGSNNVIINGNSFSGDGIKGNGKTEKETRDTTTFSKLKVNGIADVIFEQSNSHNIEVEADSNLLPLIKTSINGDVLEIYSTESFSTSNSIKVFCSSKALTEISMEGGGDVEATNIKSNDFYIKSIGSGDLDVSGTVNMLEISSTGSGDIEASDLYSLNCEVKTVGSGDTWVSCSDKIVVNTTGSGDVKIYGDPLSRNIESHGSGDVKFKKARK